MRRLVYIATFAISCSVLVFETILLKFFTFKMVSSWACLIVSMAFLGIGVSGTYLYFKKDKLLQKSQFLFLSNLSIAYTISIPFSIMFFAWIPFSPPQNLILQNVMFSLFYIVLFSIPFFLSGVCINYILTLKEFHAGRIIFFDLMGAGVGCILSVLFLRVLGAYGVLILSMLFAYLASMLFDFLLTKTHTKNLFAKPKKILPILLMVTILIYPRIMTHFYQFDIVSTNRDESKFKTFKEDFYGIEATYWNPINRVDLSREGESDNYAFLEGLSEKYRNKKYTGRYILLDGGASTRQFRFDIDETEKDFFGHFLFSILYRIMNNAQDVLIIGPGGGSEILIAKYFKVKHINVVDINSDIIDILRGKNRNDRMSHIYSRWTVSDNHTIVTYYNEEGRSFLSKNLAYQYDIVQLAGVDLLSTLLGGGLVLADNYIYTQEALEYYYNALKENGYVQICYWGGPYALRLFVTSLEMLRAIGIERPERSLVVVEDGRGYTNVIVKKGAFTEREVTKIQKICEEDNFRVFFTPGMKLPSEEYKEEINPRHYLLASKNETRKIFIKSSRWNITPTHDDKPFFYSIHSTKKDNLFRGIVAYLFQDRIIVIFISLGTVLALVFILLPLIIKRLNSEHVEEMPLELLLFFGITGLAFALIEIVLLQKLSIFVGGPFYSMCITLPTILILYSLGAFSVVKIRPPIRWLLAISIGSIVVYGFLGYLFLDKIIKSFFYLSHLKRIILTIMVISPLGFFLGFPIPLVLETIKAKVDSNIVPWMWSVNSCGNVIGALVFALITKITGFNLLLLISCCLYLIALFFYCIVRKNSKF